MRLSSWLFWAMVHIPSPFPPTWEQLLLTEERILKLQCLSSMAHSTRPRCYILPSCSSSSNSSLELLSLCKSNSISNSSNNKVISKTISKAIRIPAFLRPLRPLRSTNSSSRGLKVEVGLPILAGRISNPPKVGPLSLTPTWVVVARIALLLLIVVRGQA